MDKYKKYIKHNIHTVRLNESIYKTKINDTYYIIKDFKTTDDDLFYETIRENSILPKLNHPNIINVIDQFIYDSCIYMVLPYIKYSLYDLELQNRNQGKHFTDVQTSKIINGVLDGLFYLHEHGICHRDLKPDNIMVMEDFTPIIIDFGSCKNLSVKNTTTVSTCYYRAPEIAGFVLQRTSKSYNEKIDIWGLGCIVYELFTNKQLTSLDGDSDSGADDESIDYDDSEVFETDNERTETDDTDETDDEDYTDETDNESRTTADDEKDNDYIVRDLFRKLGVPEQHILDKFKLRRYVESDMDPAKKPIDYFKQCITDEKKLDFIVKLLNINPDKRATMEQCYSSAYINRPPPKITKIPTDTEVIALQPGKFNMIIYQNDFKRIMKKMKPYGISEKTLMKSKRLGLLYMSRYKHRVPDSCLSVVIGACMYMCGNLMDGCSMYKSDYIDNSDTNETKFNKVLIDVIHKTMGDVYMV